jgi:hypothetical protein
MCDHDDQERRRHSETRQAAVYGLRADVRASDFPREMKKGRNTVVSTLFVLAIL